MKTLIRLKLWLYRIKIILNDGRELKMESQGRCRICGKKLVTKNYCQKHRIRHSKRVLAKYHKNKLAPPNIKI